MRPFLAVYRHWGKAALGVSIITFVCVEVACRIFVYYIDSDQKLVTEASPDIWRVHRDEVLYAWRNRPDLKDLPLQTFDVEEGVRSLPRETTVSTNAHGLRCPPAEVRPDAVTILAVGDSTTFGLGVNDEETWPAQLGRLLRERRPDVDWQVLNAGVVGWTLAQTETYMRLEGLEFSPTLVLVTSGYNESQSWGPLSDLERKYVSEPLEAMPYTLACVAVARFHLRMHVWRINEVRREVMCPRLSPEEYRTVANEVVRDCEGAGAKLRFLLWPDEDLILKGEDERAEYNEVAREFASEGKAEVTDLLPAFKANGGVDLLWDPVHANEKGMRVVAEALVEVCLEDCSGD